MASKKVRLRRSRKSRKAEVEVELPDEDVVLDEVDDDEDEEETTDEASNGFNQYPVVWKGVNFSVVVSGAKFYGSWRMTPIGDGHVTAYAVDMWVEYQGHTYCVDSIMYHTDPKLKIRSLNGDLCAAINIFLYRRLSGGLETLEDMRKKAMHPIIHVQKLETIDRMIMKLREFRDTSIRTGGCRVMTLSGDVPGEPELAIGIDITSQALILKGKPPSLENGAILDAKGRKGERRGPVVNIPNAANVEALTKMLKTAEGSEARKIRATLRRMGHRGGARGAKTNG